ncbi:MAG: 50S ribosomal protein L14 [Chlorobi bacterium]|nr:50S ribosomal protein L14 [Chlorobiota bacterium]
MIQRMTKLKVADNTGAREVMCIGILGESAKKFASVGDRIVVSVKKTIPGSSMEKGKVVRAVIVRTKKEVRRKDGSYVRFDDNAVVLLNQADEPIGTRVFGPVARELRDKGFTRVVSLAPEVV